MRDPAKVSASVRKGYYSPTFYHVSDSKFASYVKQTAGRTTFDTLLLPSASAADGSVSINRLPIGSLTPDLATALDLEFGDGGGGTYYKSWSAKASRTFGIYTFDGKLLYVDTSPTGAVESLLLHDGATVKRGNTVLVKAPTAVNNFAARLSSSGTELRIEGTGLSASTDPAKAIGIAAPNATSVLLNGKPVEFIRSGGLLYAAAS